MKNELTTKQEDDLLEQGMEDYYNKKCRCNEGICTGLRFDCNCECHNNQAEMEDI